MQTHVCREKHSKWDLHDTSEGDAGDPCHRDRKNERTHKLPAYSSSEWPMNNARPGINIGGSFGSVAQNRNVQDNPSMIQANRTAKTLLMNP